MRCNRSLDASTLLDRRRVLGHPQIKNIVHHSDHATIPGLNVSAVVSWDTHKFAVPNRTPTGKRNIGRDLTHTGLYVINSDHASSLSVIPAIHPDNSFISTHRGVSTSDLVTGQSVQLPIRVADIQISATGGEFTEQTSIQIRRGSTITDFPPVDDDIESFWFVKGRK